MADEVDRNRAYLLWLLSRRDYSRAQLEKKLKLRKLSPPEIATLIDGLIAGGLFREDAYTEIRTRTLIRRGYGTSMLRAKLKSERLAVSACTIADGFAQLDSSEESQIRELLRKAFKKYDRAGIGEASKIRQKIIGAVLQKGHPYTKVRALFDELSSEATQG